MFSSVFGVDVSYILSFSYSLSIKSKFALHIDS